MDEAPLGLMGARTGHYRYESMHHGELWLDLDGLFRRPARLTGFVAALARRLRPYQPDAVCAPLTGGAFLGLAVATRLDVEFCYTQRAASAYPVSYSLAGDPELAGRRVAVVDDVINAGSATLATLAALRAVSATPVALAALLVLGARAERIGTEHGIALETLQWLDNPLYPRDGCPLYRTGVPLTGPPT